MKIALDLDGTLVDWINSPVKMAAAKLGVEEPKRHDYFYRGISLKVREEIFKFFQDPEFMSMSNLTYDIRDKLAIKRWKESGHTLYIITSRGKNKELITVTRDLVNEWFPEIDHLIIAKHGVDKIRYFKVLKLDFWIDDHPDITYIAHDLGINAYLIDKHYNRDPFFNILPKIGSVYELLDRGIIK